MSLEMKIILIACVPSYILIMLIVLNMDCHQHNWLYLYNGQRYELGLFLCRKDHGNSGNTTTPKNKIQTLKVVGEKNVLEKINIWLPLFHP